MAMAWSSVIWTELDQNYFEIILTLFSALSHSHPFDRYVYVVFREQGFLLKSVQSVTSSFTSHNMVLALLL